MNYALYSAALITQHVLHNTVAIPEAGNYAMWLSNQNLCSELILWNMCD